MPASDRPLAGSGATCSRSYPVSLQQAAAAIFGAAALRPEPVAPTRRRSPSAPK